MRKSLAKSACSRRSSGERVRRRNQSTELETLASTGNFRDALLNAANLGGNSDVVASITGALAGAHYSASAIPALWRNSLMKQGLIEGFADRLLAHALLELGD